MREIEYSPVAGLLSLIRLIKTDRNSERTRLGYTGFRGSFLSSRIRSAWSYGEIFMETRTRVPTYASVLCLAARLTLNFVAPSLWRTHLRAVRYASLYRLLFRTSGLGCVPIIPDTWISLISTAKYFKTLAWTTKSSSQYDFFILKVHQIIVTHGSHILTLLYCSRYN